jgi:hypothetical protein
LSVLKNVKISDIRKNIGSYFTDAVYKNRVVTFSRYEKEKAFLLGENMLGILLEKNKPEAKTEQVLEEDGSYTVAYKPLDLIANQDTYDEAINDLIVQAREYAEDYLENVDLYLQDKCRKEHLQLIILIALAETEEEIKALITS